MGCTNSEEYILPAVLHDLDEDSTMARKEAASRA